MIPTNVLQQARELNKSQTKDYECKYCSKKFAKESTLLSHMCEKKRRWLQEKEIGVQLALQAFVRFYELTSTGATKTYADFVQSPYYNAFVKFGRYAHHLRAVNYRHFVDYLLKKQIKLDHWCRDQHYEDYLQDYLRKEHVQDALERSIKTMTEWSEETGAEFNHYFLYASSNRVVRDITNGRISPWCVYNTNSGIDFLDKCTAEQINLMFSIIDPDFWQKHFAKHLDDVDFVKAVLKEAGI